MQEPLKSFHSELDSKGKNERILNYVEHLIWNLDALVTCNVPDLSISMLTEKTAPSLLELADFDAEALQRILDERLKKPQETDADMKTCKYPGVMALMALDRSTDCEEYLAEPLRPLMKELKDSQSVLGRISDDVELVNELTKRVDAIPKEQFNLIEKLATFPRAPIVLNKTTATSVESGNFYSMALKSEESFKGYGAELPWMRKHVYAVDEEESWRCPLHRLLFGKYRNK